jgi:hypothetical protein
MTHDPEIAIAGRQWRVPLLVPRQNRIVLPGLFALGRNPAVQYGTLCDVVVAALSRAHPDLDPEAFDDWPVPTYELLEALPVIAEQTGLLKPGRANGSSSPELPDWDAIIAEFCNLTGWTWDYCEDALTWPRIEAMYEQWRKHPPMSVLYGALHGYKPRACGTDAVAELMRMFPSGKLSAAQIIH